MNLSFFLLQKFHRFHNYIIFWPLLSYCENLTAPIWISKTKVVFPVIFQTLSAWLRECSCTLEHNKNGGNNSCCFHRNFFSSLALLCQRALKVKRAWSPRKQPSPFSPPPYTHTVSLPGRVLVYSPYWAAREQIFGLNPSAFIMAPWWRTKKESDTIIPALTSLSQHTW